jgi:hypothetical protein
LSEWSLLTLVLVAILDPMAVALLLAANHLDRANVQAKVRK